MISYEDFFTGKRITVVGLGLLGRGVGDVRFLAEQGADLIVTDLKGEAELQESLDALKEFANIRYTLGKHTLEDFQNRDLILMAPAMSADSPYIAEARKNGIPISMSTALFVRFAKEKGATIVGVTGTRGKTTTTMMIYEIVKAAGKKVILGGNIRGISTLAMLPEITAETIAVLELDSWQLQGFREEKISPDVAVFTTFYPDHLNYYHGDMDAYFADKAEIFLHQKADDTLVLGEQCAALVQQKYAGNIPSRTVVVHAVDMSSDWKLQIPGEHNRGNAACALAAARALGIPDEMSKKTIETFKGEPGRLEFLRDVGGINIYNDTTATTPDATIAALKALDPDEKKNIVLILGGADKTLDMSSLVPEVAAHCKKVLLLAGTGTEKFRSFIPDAPIYDSLEPAVLAAVQVSSPGDTILLSPAFASFGMFKNEYDRGDQFNTLVTNLA